MMTDALAILFIITIVFLIVYGLLTMRNKTDKSLDDERLKVCDAHITYGRYMLRKAKRKLKENASKDTHKEVEKWMNYIEIWEKEKYGNR